MYVNFVIPSNFVEKKVLHVHMGLQARKLIDGKSFTSIIVRVKLLYHFIFQD